MKKSTKNPFATKSVANLQQAAQNEEEILMLEVRQKLNALLMYKYQHSKASRELSEVHAASFYSIFNSIQIIY